MCPLINFFGALALISYCWFTKQNICQFNAEKSRDFIFLNEFHWHHNQILSHCNVYNACITSLLGPLWACFYTITEPPSLCLAACINHTRRVGFQPNTTHSSSVKRSCWRSVATCMDPLLVIQMEPPLNSSLRLLGNRWQ